MIDASMEPEGDRERNELFDPPEEHFFSARYDNLPLDDVHDTRESKYAKGAGNSGQSYRPGGSGLPGEDISILFSAYNGSRNVESRGRMFRVDDGQGGKYHSMQVVCAFLRYKLDPEMQRKMPGLDIHFRPDGGGTAYDIKSQYHRKNEEEEDFGYAW
ncbi:MAG: hypothetical protein QF415_01505 [Candidatus Undinarchaeales archaeon]|jgi:hypothetical protein|nr:hypothetical protein [Candidatus Undinarchaeales archaeon]MDP7493382.1 hypothetical protein [Candidatus Undinarchaeales archaeon]